MTTEKPCGYCGAPAVCFGKAWEEEVFSFACGDCCGHGSEDGFCKQVEDLVPCKTCGTMKEWHDGKNGSCASYVGVDESSGK